MQRTLIGLRIRERRREMGVKQIDLAAEIGVSPSYLNLIERNKRRLNAQLLAKIAAALDISAEDLDGGDKGLLDDLSEMANALRGGAIEPVEAFFARAPGWARVAAASHRRNRELQDEVEALSDRLANDPALGDAVHNMLTEIAALRSTSEILAEGGDMSPDQRRRFEQIVYDQSSRLSDTGGALASYFDRTSEARRRRTPRIEAEELLERAADLDAMIEREAKSALASIAPSRDIAAVAAALAQRAPRRDTALATKGFLTRRNAGAKALAKSIADRVAGRWIDDAFRAAERARDVGIADLMKAEIALRIADALILPAEPFLDAARSSGWEAEALTALADGDTGLAFRRAACLGALGAPRAAHVSVDASGALTGRRGALDLTPRARLLDCPVWPIHRVRSGGSLHAPVRMAGDAVVFAIAWRRDAAPGDADGPPGVAGADMLIVDKMDAARTIYAAAAVAPALDAGATCRICPHRACPHRRDAPVIDAS